MPQGLLGMTQDLTEFLGPSSGSCLFVLLDMAPGVAVLIQTRPILFLQVHSSATPLLN